MSFLSENKKTIIPVGVVIAVLAIGTGILSAQVSSDKIAKNVSIAGVNLGGKTKAEALKALDSQSKFKNINLKHAKKYWTVSVDDIDLNIDFSKTVDKAYRVNRDGGFFSNSMSMLRSDFGKKTRVPLEMDYSDAKLEEKLVEIKGELDSPVKNATLEYKNEKTSVIPEESGREMKVLASKSKIKNELKKDNFDIDLVVKLEEAKFKAADLKGIDTLLGAYSTNYGGVAGRSYNIEKSARDTNGVVLKPGEEFSFNGLTGDKTLARGYKVAPVIESGQLVPGIGGGVCQTSSTIFNAALLAGMEITTRRNHTIPSDYVDLGRDATVADGNPGQDFKFKNPFKHNVYIKNYTLNGKLHSQIYGSKEDFQKIDISTQMLGSFGGGNKTVVDASVPAGKKVVVKYGRPGYSVATYRIFKDEQGNTVKTEKIAISTYPAQVGLIKVGPAKPAAKPNPGAKRGPNQQSGPAVGGTTGPVVSPGRGI